MTSGEELPKVTPYLLRRAGDLCPRRLAREVDGSERSADPVNRSRMRDALLRAARDAHAELRAPTGEWFEGLGADLEPEEQAVLRQAAQWYVRIFGDRAARLDDVDIGEPTALPRRAVRLGGWLDLVVTDGDGRREVRLLELWDGRVPAADPLELEPAKVAVLRLARELGAQPLRVVWADLVRGLVRERAVDAGDDLAALGAWLDERLEIVTRRCATPDAIAGSDCGTCGHVAGCDAHPSGAHGSTRRGDLRPGIITLTPTGIDTWRRCAREWRNATLLQVPASDEPFPSSGAGHGIRMHDLLRFVHEHGDCADTGHVDDVLTAHGLGDDERVRDEVHRHVTRCPRGARAVGHEHTVARFHRKPFPLFMATARIDALWEHDGILDARDYKTGRAYVDRVAHDPQARLQAWALAPLAERLGLGLRIRFEHLSADVDDDPEPFDPDADDLATIEDELHAVVVAMRAEAAWAGPGDPAVCTMCRYRSICPVSLAPAVPIWPTLEDEIATADR